MALSGVHRIRWGGGAQEAARRTADGAVGAGAGAAGRDSGTVGGSRRHPGGDRVRRACGRRIRGRPGRARRRGGVRWRVRDRRRGSPRDAGRRRHHGRRAGGRHRHSVSGWAFRVAAPDIGDRAPGHRVPAGGAPGATPVPDPQPVGGGVESRHRGRGGRLRSGAANTASWADAMGRAVCAVPGPVASAASAGCHQLLRRGGLSDDAGRRDRGNRRPQWGIGRGAGASGVTAGRPARGRAVGVRGAAGPRATAVEQISVGSGLPIERVLGPLAMLEIAGLVEKIDGRWRLVRC